MPVVAVIGAQWGDEGKGRVIDMYAERARLVVRYGGGNNAGHTVVNDLGTFKLHLLPSGLFYPHTVNVIGSGVVIDPAVLIKEIEGLRERNISLERLFISDRAHVIMPYHVMQDQMDETMRGDGKIGTTGRGIGPVYADKMSRIGIRMGDLLNEQLLLSRLRQVLEIKNKLLTTFYGAQPLSLHEIYLKYLDYGRKLSEHITDVQPIIHRALDKDVGILLEGAQGVLLDIDYGTYPYVTSSPPGAAGAAQGSGIGPTRFSSVVGVYKAFVSRVGEGPFPSEVQGAEADALRQIGKPWAEVGTTTGRLRRVGWFDAVLARYSAQLNGFDTIAITKLDVLDDLPTVKICTGYRLHDAELDYPPADIVTYGKVEPIYEELPGWRTSTSGARHFDQLPEQAQAYVARICELVGARIGMVGVGQGRDQVIEVNRVL
ncbi:adenylosuccinate synthase [Chloroflexia bacterium SDU3-3]|nr:adenylosuccinate synthase [Chloroflexia bacterium SDU3-3]